MKTKVILRIIAPMLSVLTVFSAAAQEEPVEKPKKPEIHLVADEAPEFPGGVEAMDKFLADNIVYPQIMRKKRIEGKCYLKFVVSATGDIGTVYVMRGVADCPECDKEAVRVVKMMPAWKPGKVKGENVDVYVMLPVSFKRK